MDFAPRNNFDPFQSVILHHKMAFAGSLSHPPQSDSTPAQAAGGGSPATHAIPPSESETAAAVLSSTAGEGEY